jgi:hypothetical protein
MEKFVAPRISKAAKAKAIEIGLELAALEWRQQPKFDIGRKIFHLDHCFDVKSMRERLLTLPNPTPSDVERVITLTQVAWILKSEDHKLTSMGHKHSRGDEWQRIYREAGIDLEE